MKQDLINKIESAISETKAMIKNSDNEPLLVAFVAELSRYLALVNDHWPLTNDEKESVDIGRVAVRELDADFPNYVTLLCQISADLREDS